MKKILQNFNRIRGIEKERTIYTESEQKNSSNRAVMRQRKSTSFIREKNNIVNIFIIIMDRGPTILTIPDRNRVQRALFEI